MTTRSGRFLSEDHIYRDLTIALTVLFLLGPLVNEAIGWSRAYSYLSVGFFLFALYEITRRASDLVIGLALGLPAVASGLFNAATPDTPTINAVPTLLGVFFMGFLVWRILKDVIDGSRISSEKVYGAVCAYLLISLLFAGIYGFIALANPDAFAVSEPLRMAMGGLHDPDKNDVFTYFSFVTMTTLGYGDISPVSTAARTVAWIQAVIGQLYIAITIAALVSAHITNRNS